MIPLSPTTGACKYWFVSHWVSRWNKSNLVWDFDIPIDGQKNGPATFSLTWHKDASMLTKPTTMPKYWTNNNLIYIRYTVNLKNHWINDNDLPPLSVPLLLLSSTMDFDMATGFLLMFCDDDNGQCHPQFPSVLVHDFPSSFHLTHYALCVMIWRLIQIFCCTTSYPPHPSWFSVSDQKSTRG